MAVGAVCAWVLDANAAAVTRSLIVDWAIGILFFLSGVRRGLSFRAPEGPTMSQRAAFLWLFTLGLAALVLQPRPAATGVLVLGFASVAVLDWLAARREDAPPYFARLRPPQMAIAALSMVAVLAAQLR